jgi:TnpA family transposase
MHCPGLTFDRLSWPADWHIREETYSKALAEIINVHHKLPFARHWGDGTTSSADGQASDFNPPTGNCHHQRQV